MAYQRQTFVDGKTVLTAEMLEHMEDGIAAHSGVRFIESLDQEQQVNLRDLESGTYVLHGYFRPYAGSSHILSFASQLPVNIVTKSAMTYVQVFYPVDNIVQYLTITDDNYERKNVQLIPETEAAEQLLLKSPNGTVYKVTVNDDGTLETAPSTNATEE